LKHKKIIEEMHDLRQDFLERLSTFKHYGRGSTRRKGDVKDTALDMV
jgi:lysozyme family protein